MKKTTKNEWIFAFSADGRTIPNFIKFVTNKSPEEIKAKYGDNGYYDTKGRTAVSIWYCDEYTSNDWQSEHGDVGHEVANSAAFYYDYNLDDPALEIIKTDMIPVVDLDKAMAGKKTRDTGDYDGWNW